MTSFSKPDVHNVGPRPISLLSKDDQATATGNMYRKFRGIWTRGFLRYAIGHTDTLIARLRTLPRGEAGGGGVTCFVTKISLLYSRVRVFSHFQYTR